MIHRYPGGPILNPLGLAKDIKNAHDWKLKEIKNGLIQSFNDIYFFSQNFMMIYSLSRFLSRLLLQDAWQ